MWQIWGKLIVQGVILSWIYVYKVIAMDQIYECYMGENQQKCQMKYKHPINN